MAESDTAGRAAPSQNLAEVAALLRQAEQKLANGLGLLGTTGGLGAMIRKVAETAERMVFVSNQLPGEGL